MDEVVEASSALIVDDDTGLALTIAEVLSEYAYRVQLAHSVRETKHQLLSFRPDLVVLDFELPDGTGADVLGALGQQCPVPAIISLTGKADPTDAFLLGQRGVRTFLRKPCSLSALRAAIESVRKDVPDLTYPVRASVGKLPYSVIADGVRRTMIREALARTSGSIRGAAKILGISRQRLQYLLKAENAEFPAE